MPTQAGKGTTGPAQGVQLVNENNGGRAQPGLLKQVAHAGRAHPHKHFDKFAARDREKRHAGLPRHRLGQKRFARAGWTHQQHTFGNVRAQPPVRLRVHEKVDHLLQLAFGLVHARHVGKGDARVGLHINLGAALANRQKATHALLVGKVAKQKKPHPKKHQGR